MHHTNVHISRVFVLALSIPLIVGARSAAQPCEFDWVTINDPGNIAYGGGPSGELAGRGSVDYTFRISRLETTTAQWMEFVNTFSTQSDDWERFARPVFWGAEGDPTYDGPGRRYRLRDVAQAELLPVAGISWREAGLFCNWLHNGKSSDPESLITGAYDTTTWGDGGDGTFTDGFHHLPGARFWIPTLDEWLKASHYDPDGNGAGDPRWWLYSNSSDEPPFPGPPGKGDTNTAFTLEDWAHWDIPLGSYPRTQTPWGLLDATGAAAEWTEEVWFPWRPQERGYDGSWAGSGDVWSDQAWISSSSPPDSGGSWIGVRLASAVPAPGGLIVVPMGLCLARRRAR